jgi:hypothetical protein
MIGDSPEVSNFNRLVFSNSTASSITKGHFTHEPWPCNGEDPWLSSKGRTLGVGKVVLCSHGPSSIVWSENGPCCGTIAYFGGGKRGEGLVEHSMSQTLSIWENNLVVFVCLGTCPAIYGRICYGIYPAICPPRKKKFKSHGLLKFATSPPLGDHSPAHMSAHTPVSQAVGNEFHPPLDDSPPSVGCGRWSKPSAPTRKGRVRLH